MTLRLRLAFWYGALTATVVALACTYSYAVHSRTHYDELDRGLIATAAHVKEELAEARSDQDTLRVLGASLALGAGIRVYDPHWRLVGQSVAAAAAPPLAPTVLDAPEDTGRPYPAVGRLAPELHHAAHLGGRFTILGLRPDRWRAVILPTAAGGMRVAATIPLTPIDRAVAGFGHLMTAIGLAGALLAFLIGWLVAGRALRPVATLQEAAAIIARDQQFARRVPGGGSDELGRLASTFNAMLTSLEHAYAAQQRFVSDASHELRAPLTVIQANLELLRSPRELSPEDRQASLRESHMESMRLARLVSDLLVLARADAGAPLRRRPIPLDDLVLQTVGDAEHLARGQALRIASITPITLVADPDRIRQLLLIILDNALKYSGPERPVVVRVAKDHATAVVEVEDAGIGISPADLEHVFERFFRADPARSRDPGGTGLGLPIARWIVQQHGGELQLSSVPGQGTIATVRLPLV